MTVHVLSCTIINIFFCKVFIMYVSGQNVSNDSTHHVSPATDVARQVNMCFIIRQSNAATVEEEY